MALYGFGLLDRLEFLLMDARFAMTEREASSDVIVVDIDERSLRLLEVWPWPRHYHALVIDRLIDEGAKTVALDIDFSSRATPDDDAALEAALERAGHRAVLPVFKQYSGLRREQRSLAETGPLTRFSRHARLGSVVVRPDGDSLVRRAGTSMRWGGAPVPSFPAILSGTAIPFPSFYIDFAIASDTIPRISYVDVLRGEIPPGMFEGRSVIVGASAVELGDQFAVPRYYSLPGPFLLALAGDSLIQGRALQRTGFVPTLVIAALLMVLLCPRFGDWGWLRGLLMMIGCNGGLFLSSLAVQATTPVSLDIAAWMLMPMLSYGQSLIVLIDRQALRIFRQRMAVLHRSAMMRRIVEGSFDAVITVDHNGQIDLFNRAAERMFGHQAKDVLGRTPEFLFTLQHPDGLGPVPMNDLLAGEAGDHQSVEGDGLRQDGSRFATELSIRRTVLNISSHPLERRDTARTFHVITARDVTARREADEARERAVEEASSASRAKSEFLAAVSHELRTPLNAVIGFSEMIKDELLGEVGNEQYVSYAGDIHRSGSHLLSIINDILDISRIEAGNRELNEEEISVEEILASTMRIVRGRPEAEHRNLAMDLPAGLPNLLADERAIKQVLVNLLTNAMKFSGDGGHIAVSARTTPEGGLDLCVEDDGIGIPEDAIGRITEPFFQVDSSLSRKFEGTGLGLPLVRSLMELHGGSLHVESIVDQGTTVSCRFPPARTLPSHRQAAE